MKAASDLCISPRGRDTDVPVDTRKGGRNLGRHPAQRATATAGDLNGIVHALGFAPLATIHSHQSVYHLIQLTRGSSRSHPQSAICPDFTGAVSVIRTAAPAPAMRAPVMYQAGAMALPVVSVSNLMISCVVPPKTVVASA